MTKDPYVPRVLDDELDLLVGDLPAIAIEGAKAVGKTVTAARRAGTVRELDEPNQFDILAADLDFALTGDPPILLDEWQLLPALWDRVRRAVDAGAPPGQFLLTGSSSPARPGTHSGAGRIVSLRMRPLSLAERLGSHHVSLATLLTGEQPRLDGETDVDLEQYTEEILRSGFPAARARSDRSLRAWLDGYLHRIVDRDFPELGHHLRNPTALKRWLTAYAAATSTSTSFEKIRDASTPGAKERPAKTTVQPFRDVLERLFILDPVPAWIPSANQIRRLGSPPKHHLADPALAARLLDVNRDKLLDGVDVRPHIPRDGPLLGALFESLVTQSVRVYAQMAEATVGHLRTHGGAHEVDLIVERGDGRVVAIEVKLASVPDESSGNHLRWLGEQIGSDLLDSVIITTGRFAYRRPDGIAVVPAALLGP
jgi:uncharacterized protein